MPLLELEEVGKHFGGLPAVDGVNLGVDEGEILAIVGPNGAGKSTLLKLIVGLERLFKLAAKHRYRRGFGFIVAPHYWFFPGLIRDSQEEEINLEDGTLLSGIIGPPYHRVLPHAVRHHIYDILRGVLDQFQAACPGYTVEFEVIASEYTPVMLTRLGAGDAPDLFYVQQGYSQDWINEGVLQPLDELAAQAGFDIGAFYPGYLQPFQKDGQTYGFPKDSSILGMQTNDQMLSDAGVTIPTTVEELDLEEYKDLYVERLTQLIETKVAGQEVVQAPADEGPTVINLMDALKASVEQSKAKAPSTTKKAAAKKAPPKKMPAAARKRSTTKKKKTG